MYMLACLAEATKLVCKIDSMVQESMVTLFYASAAGSKSSEQYD